MSLVKAIHKEKAELLNSRGYDVQLFSSFDLFRSTIINRRAAVVMVSDEGSVNQCCAWISALSTIPEASGARMILTISQNNERILNAAAAANFRDLIPIDTLGSLWLQRIAFATANHPITIPRPEGELTLHSIAAVAIPARVVWVSEKRIWIESRLRPIKGSTLVFNGSLANQFGVRNLTLTVEEQVRRHLKYRFSDAFIASWSVPPDAKEGAQKTLESLRAVGTIPKCRVFVAAQSQVLRQRVFDLFDPTKFEVTAALQRHNLAMEPRFFSPQAIIIEAALFPNQSAPQFVELLKCADPGATILIVGPVNDFEAIKKINPEARVVVTNEIPPAMPMLMIKRFSSTLAQLTQTDADACHLASESSASKGSIEVSARLTSLHIRHGQIRTQAQITNFALLQLDAPLLRKQLGRSPWIKLTSTASEDIQDAADPVADSFQYRSDFFLADERPGDSAILARFLEGTLRESFKRSGVTYAGGDPATGTPENVVMLPPPPPNQIPKSEAPRPVMPVHNLRNPNPAEKVDPPKPKDAVIQRADFVSQAEQIINEIKKDGEKETIALLARMTIGARAATQKQTLIFVGIILFVATALWAFFEVLTPDPQDIGKVWSDSFKQYQLIEGNGGRKRPSSTRPPAE